MAPMTNRVKVLRCFQGLTIDTNNFAFGLSDVMLLESTIPDGRTDRGLDDDNINSAQLELGLWLSFAIPIFKYFGSRNSFALG